jgi:hypothetical protein
MKQLSAIKGLFPPCLKHKIGIHKNTAPRINENYNITEQDILNDLHEGRE